MGQRTAYKNIDVFIHSRWMEVAPTKMIGSMNVCVKDVQRDTSLGNQEAIT